MSGCEKKIGGGLEKMRNIEKTQPEGQFDIVVAIDRTRLSLKDSVSVLLKMVFPVYPYGKSNIVRRPHF